VLISADPETGKERWKINMEFLISGNSADNMLYDALLLENFGINRIPVKRFGVLKRIYN
jgi:hypothetical protein